jgi:2',3'-cyclic-nucleotide 2'-phosphodiesterase (5'-nucleotidase family)
MNYLGIRFFKSIFVVLSLSLGLVACTHIRNQPTDAVMHISLMAFNDLHGHFVNNLIRIPFRFQQAASPIWPLQYNNLKQRTHCMRWYQQAT